MRKQFLIVLLSVISYWAHGQLDTIYAVAEVAPRFYFSACEAMDTTATAKAKCAEQAMFALVYGNIQYPMEARMENIEGTVVASFVVEPDSSISNLELLRDIGGGCGDAVLAVFEAIQQSPLKWHPGMIKGQQVRTRMNIPIKFKLEEAPPYVMIAQDTVYTQLDKAVAFKETDGLEAFIASNLAYPESYKDSCLVGYMDAQLLIQPDGVVKTLNVLDHFNLGLDFQFKVLDLTSAMFNKWEPASYQDRKVPSSLDMRLTFLPTSGSCTAQIDRFKAANVTADEAYTLIANGNTTAGLEKLGAAIKLLPNNTDWRGARAEYNIDLGNYKKACEDLKLIQAMLGSTGFDSVLPTICKLAEVEEEEK